ncbi:alanine racemase [Winogradskyella immobilis]|uniref:Alanine racemase n=1 Tax=Winogradskyella immobilis TaxID=2816852 RepID=A0ABS8EPM9_9FLAO|nr:alanine racemase [Winogradskyella immobilis]MCC1485070.1 alanine racemase [Winogradskyella immobilis]MCG0017162.1 alanine racemase [Winogradskyella immobilis]
MTKAWYKIEDINKIDSPSIVLYKERLLHNLQHMTSMTRRGLSRLMPHVKTNKMPKVIELMVTLGIKNFKTSTIAEAEIAAGAGAEYILLAHQLVGPKFQRFCELLKHFQNVKFATIIDNPYTIKQLNNYAATNHLKIDFFIDINSGMNRSGIKLGKELELLIKAFPNYHSLVFKGFHVYDGHLRNIDFEDRKHHIENEFNPVKTLFHKLKETHPDIKLICGGTPSFTTHIKEENRITSPGTCVLWDWGYAKKLKEQNFKYAALLITRVISKPTNGIITIDLGHKSVASENPIHQRIKFLNLKDYQLISQSEEHGVLSVKNWKEINIGDVFYGVPYHICPTINLHDNVSVISNEKLVDYWEITARKRRLMF